MGPAKLQMWKREVAPRGDRSIRRGNGMVWAVNFLVLGS